MNYKLKTLAGDEISTVASKAKVIAQDKSTTVEFDFNGIQCLVNSKTDLEMLLRDYHNAFTMKWKTIGPNCAEYSTELQYAIDEQNRLDNERWEKEKLEAKAKADRQRDAFNIKTKGVLLALKDADIWSKTVEINTDGYGSCFVGYAEGWAKLMQVEIGNGATVKDCAERSSLELGFFGITGFMYSAAISILSECWVNGEDLRKWHNKEYSHNGAGVVNAALLTTN